MPYIQRQWDVYGRLRGMGGGVQISMGFMWALGFSLPLLGGGAGGVVVFAGQGRAIAMGGWESNGL